jgi:cation:H+ antiporter
MPHLWLTIALLLGSAIVIYLSCELFVNGVEWVGAKLAVGQKATGSILAAFGTALPESVVTLVAVLSGTDAGKDLGVGAALGGPLALSTVAYATVGITLLLVHQRLPKTAEIRSEFRNLSRDQGWFLMIFAVKIALGLFVLAWKPWLGFLFLAAYALYVRQEMGGHHGSEEEGEREPLTFQRKAATPSTVMALLQTGLALAVIFIASRTFVAQLEALGPLLGLPHQLLALLLSPIATELPETLNAVIWVRQGKTSLALGNISGAMMIQATVPSALGMFFTPWMLDRPLLWAGAVTMAAIAVMLVLLYRHALTAKRLVALSALYGLFALGAATVFR